MEGLTHAQTAHTISQRIRSLKKLPAELIPLCTSSRDTDAPSSVPPLLESSKKLMCKSVIVVGVAVFAAVFSIVRKFYVDKTLRLKRQGKIE